MRAERARNPSKDRSSRGTASLSLAETLHPLLVIGNPGLDLFPTELAWWWKLSRAAQPGDEEKEKLLLLLRRKRIGGGFNFSQRAHG